MARDAGAASGLNRGNSQGMPKRLCPRWTCSRLHCKQCPCRINLKSVGGTNPVSVVAALGEVRLSAAVPRSNLPRVAPHRMPPSVGSAARDSCRLPPQQSAAALAVICYPQCCRRCGRPKKLLRWSRARDAPATASSPIRKEGAGRSRRSGRCASARELIPLVLLPVRTLCRLAAGAIPVG